MPDTRFNTALIVGAGAGLSASLARALAKDGIRVALAARTPGDLDALTRETGALAFACDASKRGEVEKLFAEMEAACGGARDRDLQCELPHARAVDRARPGRGRKVDRGLGLRRLSGRPAGGAPHAAETAWRHPVHGRVRERQGLCPIGALRDGQVRAARARPEPGARARAA